MQQQKLRDQGNKEACMDFNFSGLTQYSWSHSLQIYIGQLFLSSLLKHPGSRVALCLAMYKHLAAKRHCARVPRKRKRDSGLFLKYQMLHHVNQRITRNMHCGVCRHVNRNHVIHLYNECVSRFGIEGTKHCKTLWNNLRFGQWFKLR